MACNHLNTVTCDECAPRMVFCCPNCGFSMNSPSTWMVPLTTAATATVTAANTWTYIPLATGGVTYNVGPLVRNTNVATATKNLIQAGFTPDSVAQAIQDSDFGKLRHAGSMNVELSPPDEEDPPPAGVRELRKD